MSSVSGLGRSPGGEHDHPLWYSCLENPMDRAGYLFPFVGLGSFRPWLLQIILDPLLVAILLVDLHALYYPIGLLYCFHFFFFIWIYVFCSDWIISILSCVCVCVRACTQLLQSCLILCNGLLPARLLYSWNSPGKNTGVVATFSFRGSSWPRDQTCISCIAGVFFTHWATWEAHSILQITYLFFCIIQSAVLCI